MAQSGNMCKVDNQAFSYVQYQMKPTYATNLILNFHLAVLSAYHNALCFIQANLTYFELAKKIYEDKQNEAN